MKKSLLIMLILIFTASFSIFATGTSDKAEVEVDNSVEVLHWWTSGGEAAALNVLKTDLEAQGIEWIDAPVAGGGGGNAMTVLKSRATSGNPPAAVQMLGFDILDMAELGILANLNEVAEAQRENNGLGEWRKIIQLGPKMCEVWERLEPITIAAINGWCIGGGVALTCAARDRAH